MHQRDFLHCILSGLLVTACHPTTDRATLQQDSAPPAAMIAAPASQPDIPPGAWTSQTACDSASVVGLRELPGATAVRGTDSLQVGEGPYRPACRVMLTARYTGQGDPPFPFDGGITGTGWTQVLEFEADGESARGFGFRRPGVVCSVLGLWNSLPTYTVQVRCAPDLAAAVPSAPPKLPDPTLDTPLAVVRDGEDACYHYSGHTIAANDLDSTLGSDFYIREGPNGSCAFDSLPGDFVIRNAWAEYYLGLSGNTLILDSGTGVKRAMIFYDLHARKKYFEGGYNDLSGGGPPGTIGTWGDADLDPVANGCGSGSQVIVEQLTWVTIATGETHPAGIFRCGFTE